LIKNIESIDQKRIRSQREARNFYLASVGELEDKNSL